jgi:hypothetical protein
LHYHFETEKAEYMSINILILFAPKFEKFGVDVGKEYIRRNGGGKVHGLCAGPESIREYVKKQLGHDAGFFWHLHSEEAHWLSGSQSTNNLVQIDQELGPGAVGRIMVADRRVGRGFVRGGLCRPDNVGKACAVMWLCGVGPNQPFELIV